MAEALTADRAFKPEFWKKCRLRTRAPFYDWAGDSLRAAFRKSEYADIAAGRPARSESLLLVLSYLVDESNADHRDPRKFKMYLDGVGIPDHERTPEQLFGLLTEPSDPRDPLTVGMPAIKDLFETVRDPWGGVRPCAQEDIGLCTRWMFIDGGRRLSGKRLGEAEAIKWSEDFIDVELSEYCERLVEWRSAVPWSVVVGGDQNGKPIAMSVAAPLCEHAYQEAKSGKLAMFRYSLPQAVQCSPYLYAEAIGRCAGPRTFSLTPTLVHIFRTVLCQQAVLSDVEGIGDSLPLRILCICGVRTIQTWIRRFGYRELEARTPGTDIPLWERVLWDKEHGWRESAHLGVWRAIQRHFRELAQSTSGDKGATGRSPNPPSHCVGCEPGP